MSVGPSPYHQAGFAATLRQRFTSRLAETLPAGRNRRLAIGMASGVATKSIIFSLTLITVPMTLHYLGPERYGIWVTMISMLAWLNLVDLGIANGLTPALSAAFGSKRYDLAQQYIATAFWALVAIAVLVGAVSCFLWSWLDWHHIFNVSPSLEGQVATAVAVAFGIFLLNLPFSITQRIFLAYQEGLMANLAQLAMNVAGVVGIFAVIQMQGGLVSLVLGYSGAQLVVLLLCTGWLFGRSKPQLRPMVRPNRAQAKYVLSLGGMFFINQIAALFIFHKDSLLITFLLGPAHATPFSVAWQMFLYLNAINLVVTPYLGPTFGEAFAVGDLHWMRQAFRRYIQTTCALAVPAVALLTWFHRSILAAWAGPEIIPTLTTVLWMAFWSAILIVQGPLVSILTNTGRLHRLTIFYVLAASLNLPLSVFLIKQVGVSGGIIASTVTTVVCVTLPASREVFILLKNLPTRLSPSLGT